MRATRWLATTFAGFIAAALEIRDPYAASRAERQKIQQAHLLLAAANAMQPGVFSLSSWDLVGALPISEKSVAERMKDGDYRWINRGGVDLMGANPSKDASHFGVERAKSLYGSLREQLDNPDSFARQLARMLKARKKYRLAEGDLLAVPRSSNAAVCVHVMQPPGAPALIVTALNFSQQTLKEEIDLNDVQAIGKSKVNGQTVEIITNKQLGKFPENGRLKIELPPLTAKTIRIGNSE
jgi:trehalose synthase